MTDAKLPMCPRCETDTTEVLTKSPDPGVWGPYRRPVCFFAWRSTEPDFITDPKKYDPNFKFKPEDMKNFQVTPTLPELINR
jgi:vanillate/4-hydroxybenzoate decarboxylase subunit D